MGTGVKTRWAALLIPVMLEILLFQSVFIYLFIYGIFFPVKTMRKFPSNLKNRFGKSQNDLPEVLMSF